MKSKMKLFETLDAAMKQLAGVQVPQYAIQGLKHRKIMNETFGKSSHIFVVIDEFKVNKDKVRNFLKAEGHKVSDTYWPESSVLDVQVSYFKGWHFDE